MPRRRVPPTPALPPPPPPPPSLSEEEASFVRHYVAMRNNARAYRAVYPDCTWQSAAVLGCELAQRPHVAAEIKAAVDAHAAHLNLHARNVMQEFCRIGLADPIDLVDAAGVLRPLGDVPIDLRRAIQSYKVNRERTVRRTVVKGATTSVEVSVSEQVMEVKLWNKVDALTKLAGLLGLKTSDLPPVEALVSLLPEPLQAKLRPFLAAAAAAAASAASHPED